MNLSPFALALGLLAASPSYAASASTDTPLTGVPMNAAKRLDARSMSASPVAPSKLSGVPMALAVRLGGSMRPGPASTQGHGLSGVPMSLVKRL